jgi:hypothetical protein
MAKAKTKQPEKKTSAKKAKAAPSKGRKAKGRPMFRMFFYLLVLGGLGYAAFTVPYHGRTAKDWAWKYVEHHTDFRLPHFGSEPPAVAGSKKGHDAVADRRSPVHAPPAAPHATNEHITQSDRDALDRLIPH